MSPRTTWSSWPPKSGVLDIPAEQHPAKGRLQPGRMFLMDTEEGRIVADEEIKRASRPTSSRTREWLSDNLVSLA